MSERASFGLLDPVGGGDPIPLLKPRIVIGRRPQCDIVLAFANVSSLHCELEFMNGFWQVRDLNSRNGIKVNGERCDSRWLQPGDELSVAKHAFVIQYQPDAEAPPVAEEDDPLALSLLEKAGLMRQRSRGPRLKSARPVDLQDDSKFSSDENEAGRYLFGDE